MFLGGYDGNALYCAGVNSSNKTKAVVFAEEQTYFDCATEGLSPQLISAIYTKELNQMVTNVRGIDEFEVMQTTKNEMQLLLGMPVHVGN